MKYTFHEKLGDRKGVVSNLHGLLHRHMDTGFKSKWSGYWVPPYKFLDYYGIRLNGIWLNSDTLKAAEYGEKMVFHHETDSLNVREVVRAPPDLPGFRLELEVENGMDSRKAVQASLEAGIDIRPKDSDVEDGNYDLDRKKDRLIASKEDKKLVIQSESFSGFTGDRYRKEHYPGEKQVALVPEKPVFRAEIDAGDSELFEIDFKTSDAVFGEIDSVGQDFRHSLGRCFKSGIESLENLTYSRKERGIIAGHPWFQSYWARDTFWSLLGYIDTGYFELSQEILENFAERGLKGKIPLEGETEQIHRDDTEPLFVIASEKLRRHYGITEKLEEAREEAMEKLETDEKGIVEHSPMGTWTDTIERQKAVDIQSLWLEAAEIMDDPSREKLSEGLKEFRNGDHLVDCAEDSCGTINPVVPVMLGQVGDELADSQLEKINGEFSSRYGARTRSVTDPGYDSSGYHTGSVWGLTTCWSAAANLRYGKYTEGVNFLEKMQQFLDRNQPSAFPEVVDAESGALIGASEQAWSAGMFLHVVDSYLLGIKAEENCVKVEPSGKVSCVREGKRVKGEKLDLKFDRGSVEVLNQPDLDIRIENPKSGSSVDGI